MILIENKKDASFKDWLHLDEAAIDEKYPFKAVIMAG
jgi:hypothetical protein